MSLKFRKYTLGRKHYRCVKGSSKFYMKVEDMWKMLLQNERIWIETELEAVIIIAQENQQISLSDQ